MENKFFPDKKISTCIKYHTEYIEDIHISDVIVDEKNKKPDMYQQQKRIHYDT